MAPQQKKPNFLIIVADDLGFSDTSPYGGEIHTPNLMKLANEGLRMTNFHTAASCSPTRAMLLSGTDSHIAGLGAMAENMAPYKDLFEGRPGYEGYLNERVAALPEILQDNGYFTLLSGKWHLGLTKERSPHARGFERVFTWLPGAGNHYAHEPQLAGLPEKPKKFVRPDQTNLWMKDGDFIKQTDVPKDFYSSTSYTDYFLDFLEERTEEQKEKPFMGFVAYTAPHWPLQVPARYREKYRGWYDKGPVALRDQRVESLIKNGIIPADVEPPPLHRLNTTPWAELPPDDQVFSCRTMETFAGMVDCLDENVGRIYQYLEDTGELDNTFIVFMSDNGAEGQLLEAVPILAGMTFDQLLSKYYDNSLENVGNYNSYVWYGPQWAGAATAPGRGAKAHTTEGGIHCPCIVRYPPMLKETNAINETLTTVMDVLPTILELSGIPHPGTKFRGRDVALPRGHSWAGLMQRPNDTNLQLYDPDNEIIGWEQIGIAAVRKGNWKAIWMPPPEGLGRWELYDLGRDLGEIHDLSDKEPEKMKEMILHYETYFQETGMFDSYALVQERIKADKAAAADKKG
ncbi:putative arylsulfatase [Xylariomycetidae sp. FL0641]|nr:putative arylsulfatase [Xylariomycetidae sp. FL0641]